MGSWQRLLRMSRATDAPLLRSPLPLLQDALYNFVGLVLGHGGATVQRIQKASGAKIEVRGRGRGRGLCGRVVWGGGLRGRVRCWVGCSRQCVALGALLADAALGPGSLPN